MTESPLSVAVLVGLERGAGAGGHVKCWERFAEAATALPDRLKLTVFYLGDEAARFPLSDQVAFETLPPVFSTRRLKFLEQGAGHTDLARFHPQLAKRLAAFDVLHATDFFSFGRTALHLGRRKGKPVVASIHTDVPKFTGIYTGEIVRRRVGDGWLSRILLDQFRIDHRAARAAEKSRDKRIAQCRHVLVSKLEDLDNVRRVLPESRVSFLRRGVDRKRFNPDNRDRARLAERFGLDPQRPVVLFVGRADDSKSVMTMAGACRRLINAGSPLQALIVGEGYRRPDAARLLGDHGRVVGHMPQEDLGWIYASSDVFAFPSRTEVSPNVVLEAKASGLACVVAADHGGGQFIAHSGQDGVVVSATDDGAWAAAMAPLLDDPAARAAMSAAAREWIETRWPSWDDVLDEDLLPVWEAAAERARAVAA